ncbi:MAG: hypothetical protein HQ582_15120, partial [Planctomycetes bacterium]|nr:hypothetical protein [Planctomycetota bacterium]
MRKNKSKRGNRGIGQARRKPRGFQSARRHGSGLFLEPLETRLLLSVTPQLIDLDSSGASEPAEFVEVGDVAFFVAEDTTHGRELWKTDGTPQGTTLVEDINSGTSSSDPSNLVEYNGELYFVADDGTNGEELWKSDGTEAGTVLVKDINSGSGYQYPYGDGPLQSFPRDLTVVNGKLFFSAEDADHGSELWMSDGTGAGTVLVKDIVTGTHTDDYGTYPNSSNPQNLTDVNGTLFFTADDGETGRELWKSNGTASGTVLVKDIVTGTHTDDYGTYPNASNPQNLTDVNGTLFFTADDGDTGRELWKSNGTASG